MSRHSSRRTNTTFLPLHPTTETNHTTTKLYDDVERMYTDTKYPHSPQQHSSTDGANVSHSSDTLPRKTDLECEYVQLECPLHAHTQEDSSCNDTLPRKGFDTTQQEHEEGNNTDGLISTGQNDKRSHQEYSLSLHETTPCLLDSGGHDSGSLTLTNPVITPLTPNYSHFTQSDPCLSVPEASLTAPEVSTYHDERLTPSVLNGPELTPCEPGVIQPTVTYAESESCTLSNPEITPCNPAYSEFNPFTLSYSPSEGIPLTPPRPGSPDPIYANINVMKSEVPNKSSMSNRVKELVYQFENQLLSEPSDAETDQEP